MLPCCSDLDLRSPGLKYPQLWSLVLLLLLLSLVCLCWSLLCLLAGLHFVLLMNEARQWVRHIHQLQHSGLAAQLLLRLYARLRAALI